ncbi:unnamed protein product, partial [Adineta steineri]
MIDELGSSGLADILAWVCDKIRSGGTCTQGSEQNLLTPTFLRELKVLVNQLLGNDLTDDLIKLITYLAVTRCKKIRVCDDDDDLSLYLLEASVTVFSANQNQRLSSLKLHLLLAFDLNQPKFASRMLRANQDMPEEDPIQLAKMAIIRDQVEFLHVLEDTCGITSDNLGEKFECELSSKMADENNETAEDEIESINVKLFLWANLISEYEQLAMRLVQCLYLSNPNLTRLALKRENFEFNKLSSLEVA